MTAELEPYQQVLVKIESKTREVFARREQDIACRKGCAKCCIDGLTVLPVEAATIVEHIRRTNLVPKVSPDNCAFLDSEGACQIYSARPVLCRTHGLPIRIAAETQTLRPGKSSHDESISVCDLNFVERAPDTDDIIDGALVQALLTTVNQMGHADDTRISLRELAKMLSAETSV